MLQCQALLRWPDYVRIRSEKQGFINLWTSLSPNTIEELEKELGGTEETKG